MARIAPAPTELLALAQENGWTVNEFLPDRYDACASKQVAGATVIVTRETGTCRWLWSVAKGANWGKGDRSGRCGDLTAAVATATGIALDDAAVLF